MLLKSFVCLLLVLSITAKYFTINSDLEIKEIDEELALLSRLHEDSVANVQLNDTHYTTGWAYVTVQTDGSYPDWLQGYAAGYLEGYLTYDLIWATKNNKQIALLEMGLVTMPKKASEFIQNQTNWINETIYSNPDDNYWNLVNATMSQLYGMYDGYVKAVNENNKTNWTLTFDEFYLITYAVDLPDVVSKYSLVDIHLPRCSFLLKIIDDSLYVGQTTWTDFTDMVRTYRVYNFNFQNPLVNAKKISFSSQPGAISSQDDFYIIDGSRVVAETTIVAYNPLVYEYLHYDSIPYWVRVTLANLAFTDQSSWADMYFKHRSGTYNDQWLVVDFNSYNASKGDFSHAKDIIWMIEEFYTLTSAIDVTQELLVPQGYVASYNAPYNKTLWELSKNLDHYDNNPRAKLFAKYAPEIKNLEDFQNVMRKNNHSDTDLYCLAIAPRCDLQSVTDIPFGAIDCKITNDNMVTQHQAWIQSGPTTYGDLPPFNWTDWPRFDKKLAGMPEIFNFTWQYVDPSSNFTNLSDEAITIDTLLW